MTPYVCGHGSYDLTDLILYLLIIRLTFLVGFQMGGSTGTGAFGQSSTVSPFGQPAATGFGGLGGFSQPTQATSAPAFGASSGMFGAAPATGGMFGQQPAQSAFGAQASTGFSFGQPAAQQATGNMFGAPAAAPAFGATPAFGGASAFGTTPAFGATPAFGSAPAFGSPAAQTTGFGGLGGGFGGLGGFGQPAAAATTGFGAAAPAATSAFGGFGAPSATPTSAFGGFSFGAQPAAQPATGNMFGAPAAAPAFGASAGSLGFGSPSAFGAPAAQTTGFGGLGGGFGGLGGFGQPAAAATTGFGAAAPAATSAFGGFGAPAASTGGMFGSLGGFGQTPLGASAAPAFGGFGGFGAASQAAKPQATGFSAAPATTPAWCNFGAALGAPATQQNIFGMPSGGQAPVQQTQYPPMEHKMELLRSKKDELDVQLKDARIYGTTGSDSGSVYSGTTFSIPRSLPTYQHTSRSTTKIVPRGLVSSVSMSALQRPLSAVLSAASNGGSTMDLMSPEKLLGRSAKRLIIVSSGLNGVDPTIDLPPPSYQQKQAVRFLSNEPEGASPPRALMLDASTGQRRPLPISNGGDVTGLTPSTTRSPYTPTSGGSGSGSGGAHTPTSGSSASNSTQERPLKPRLTTPYVPRGERDRESLDRSTNSIPEHEPSPLAFEAPLPPTLLRPGYLTTPSIAALKKMTVKELAKVRNFSVYRPNIGRIEWEGETDVRGLDLDLIVNIEKRGVEVYDSEEAALMKPEVGFGLNKTAIVYLSNIFPPEGASDLKKSQFLDKLKFAATTFG